MMTDAERDRLKLELRVGRILGRSMVGKLRPIVSGEEVITGGRMLRRHFPGAVISVGTRSSGDLARKLQALPDDGYSTLYDHNGRVISRRRGWR